MNELTKVSYEYDVKLLGFQHVPFPDKNPAFRALLENNELSNDTTLLAVDSYNLGLIHGIRKERARRKN